jgi:hypothetical protein
LHRDSQLCRRSLAIHDSPRHKSKSIDR